MSRAASKAFTFASRVGKSAVLPGLISAVIGTGGNMILLPLMLKKFSEAELALWWVFLSMGALASLADFGFGAAMTRVYSYFWAGAKELRREGLDPGATDGRPNRDGIFRLHASASHLYLRIAMAVLLLLGFGGTAILIRPAKDLANWGYVGTAWALYLIGIGHALATTHWSLACQGINRVREQHQATVMGGAVYLVLAGTMIALGWGLYALVIATLARGIIVRTLCRWALQKALGEELRKKHTMDPEILRNLWPSAWKFGCMALGAFMCSQSSIIVSSQMLDNSVTAPLGLTLQVGTFLVNASALWLSVKWPEITGLRVQGRLSEMSILFARRFFLSMATLATSLLLLTHLGNSVVGYVKASASFLPAPLLGIYGIYLLQRFSYSQFGMLTFTENVVPFFKLSIGTGVAVVLLTIALAPTYKAWGIVLAPLAAELVGCTWYPVWRGFRGQNLSVARFVRAGILGHT
jgi:hypothetical protein